MRGKVELEAYVATQYFLPKFYFLQLQREVTEFGLPTLEGMMLS